MRQLFDIFSKKTSAEKAGEKLKILIDYREKNSLVISELVSLGIIPEFTALKVADYIVKGTAIERKTVSDFISSMLNRRLISQLEEMQQYESRLLIIEGVDEQEIYSDEFSEQALKQGGLHPNSVRGFLLSILLKYKVPIIFTKNYSDTARFISVLLKKQETEPPLNAKKKALNKKEQLQYILEGFPGIGPKTARKLLKKFKTIKNIFNASEEDLKSELGKKRENFLRIINQTY